MTSRRTSSRTRYWKISTILSPTESKWRTSTTLSCPRILRLSRLKTISSTFRTQWYASRLIGGTRSASSLLCSRRPIGILSHKRNLIILSISAEIHSWRWNTKSLRCWLSERTCPSSGSATRSYSPLKFCLALRDSSQRETLWTWSSWSKLSELSEERWLWLEWMLRPNMRWIILRMSLSKTSSMQALKDLSLKLKVWLPPPKKFSWWPTFGNAAWKGRGSKR